jgi:pimeloyl-ACP methyl ester carboxylesterase
LVTDELVDYIHWVARVHQGAPAIGEPAARLDKDLAAHPGARPASRLVPLNNCGHWPPFEKPAEWTAQVLEFLRGY